MFSRRDKPERTSTLHDELLSLHRQVASVQTRMETLEAAWAEVLDRVKRSYQRNERALQRLQERQEAPPQGPQVPGGLEAAEEHLTPFEKKLRQVKGAG